MIKSLKYISIFALLIAKSGTGLGQSQNDPRDSLYYYLELAAGNNPSVLQLFYEYQAALQKVPQIGSLPDPELTIGVFLKPMELVMGNQTADIKLMQMFPWFGSLKAAKDEMSLMAKAKYESFRDAKLQVFYDVRSTWYELYKLNQDISISDKNLQILKTIERLALVRFRTSGGAGLSDIYRIQIEIGDLENNIALLKNRQSTVGAKFNSYINRPAKSAIEITDTLIADTLITSLAAVSDSILRNNPILSMLQYEQQSLDSRKKMVTRMGYPMVGLGVDYSTINKSEMSASPMNGKDMIMPMVSATIPIYRKKYKAMQTEADLLKTATVQNYTATANSLQAEYYQAVQLYQDANRRMNLYLNQYQLARKSLNIMLKSFSASGSSLTDILRIQQQTLDYELKQVQAVADYNTSIAWLKRLMANSQF
jgi:cobalt-zinc-cadmium efflux system outer membrane protein